VGDGGLTTNDFTNADHTKLDGIEASADVTDATNVSSAGALMKTGGALTGAVTTNSTFDGVDIATRDGVLTSTTTTANAALPKAGGTMTGTTAHGDSVKATFGDTGDLEIMHDGAHSNITESGTGDLRIRADNLRLSRSSDAELYMYCTTDAGVQIYHNGNEKLETTSAGIDITGRAKGTLTTDNDGSFDMSASNNFKCTPAGNFTLIVSQSGFILLVNTGGHTVSAHANSKVDANLLATVTAAGTYLVSYFSDGTNVYLTNSAIYT